MGRHERDRDGEDRERKKETKNRSSREKKDRHDYREDEDRRKRRGDDDRKREGHSRSRDPKKEEKRKKKRKHERDDEHSSEEHELDRTHHDRRDRKERKRQKKDKKHRKRDEKEKEPKIKKKKPKNLISLGEILGKPPEKTLTVDQDYFTHHEHLWVYLYREGIAFNDLTSDQARAAFARFAAKYNAGKLEAAYYDEKGLPLEAVEQSKTTSHSWAFQTSQTERDNLHLLQEGVRKQTEYVAASTTGTQPLPSLPNKIGKLEAAPAPEERRGKTPEERHRDRVVNRRLKAHVRTAEEELGGGKKDYGRERQLEKRKEQAAAIHGAHREKEEARMGGVELNDEALYGGDGTNFQQTLARQRERKSRREQEKSARIAELQKKEDDKQKAMLQMLGLSAIKPGEKIKIAPRNDGK